MYCLEMDSVVILKSSLALAWPNVCPPCWKWNKEERKKYNKVFLEGLSSGVSEHWYNFTQVIFLNLIDGKVFQILIIKLLYLIP